MSLPNLMFRIGRRGLSEATRVVWLYDRLATARYAPDVKAPIDPPPVLIVGAPRTGSTLLYQVITNVFNVAYISNLSRLFYHAPLTGQQVDGLVLRGRPHNTFRSERGCTPGLIGPNECGMFWYRWFPREPHFIAEGQANAEAMEQMRREIAAVATATGKPLVVKNLNNGQRLQPISRVLPEALLIYIRRDPFSTAASLLQGRIGVYGDKNRWWSVKPKNVKELQRLPYPEQVVKQVWHVQKQIEEDLPRFPERQILKVQYEELCADLPRLLDNVRAFFSQNGVHLAEREGAVLPRLEPRKGTQDALSDQDLAALREEVQKLAW